MVDHSKHFKRVGLWVGMGLFVIIILSSVIGVYFLTMAGTFELLGVQYHSVWGLIGFVAGYFLIGFIFDLFFNPLAAILSASTDSRSFSSFITIGLDIFSNILSLSVMNLVMSSVALTEVALLTLAVAIALIEFLLDKDRHAKSSSY
ncbi:YrvL family regulatory protein [Alkalibacillus sp. S2W]|uniref:YrvL family regulatory protein n=1 Tax=Alkalibacillus sp. S2W TaxID=3386553 RepID=UPI00398CE419